MGAQPVLDQLMHSRIQRCNDELGKEPDLHNHLTSHQRARRDGIFAGGNVQQPSPACSHSPGLDIGTFLWQKASTVSSEAGEWCIKL